MSMSMDDVLLDEAMHSKKMSIETATNEYELIDELLSLNVPEDEIKAIVEERFGVTIDFE